MSNPLKKVAKGVKKQFKRVVKTIKKVVQSKVFKVVAIAVAVYFAAPAIAGYLGSAGAAAGAGTTSAVTAGGGINAAGWAAAETGAAVTGAAVGGSAGGSAIAGLGAAAGGMTAGQGLLASAALSTGGNMLSAYAQGQKEEEFIKQIGKNNKHDIDVYGNYQRTMDQAGGVEVDANGNTIYSQKSLPKDEQTEQPKAAGRKFYNASNDTWSPVQKVASASARSTDSNPNAQARSV